MVGALDSDAHLTERSILLLISRVVSQRILVPDVPRDLYAGSFHALQRFGKVSLSARRLSQVLEDLLGVMRSAPVDLEQAARLQRAQ